MKQKNDLKKRYEGNYGDNLKSIVISSLYLFQKKGLIRGKVLDVGCGHGQNLPFFYKVTGVKPTGLDINKKMVEEIRKNGFEAIQNDLDELLPIDDCSFDIIYCNQVLEHVESPYKVLKEFNRILKNNGRLIIGVPNGIRDKSSFKGSLHINFWTPKTLEKTLVVIGFKPIQILADVPTFIKNGFIRKIFAENFLIKKYRRAFFIIAKKND